MASARPVSTSASNRPSQPRGESRIDLHHCMRTAWKLPYDHIPSILVSCSPRVKGRAASITKLRRAAVKSLANDFRIIAVTQSPLSSPLNEAPTDPKGKRRAARSPTPRAPSSELSDAPPPKRPRKSAKTSSSEERYSLRNKSRATEDEATPGVGSLIGKAKAKSPTKEKGPTQMSKRGG